MMVVVTFIIKSVQHPDLPLHYPPVCPATPSPSFSLLSSDDPRHMPLPPW